MPIVLERSFHVPSSKVWNAITDKDEMKNWYFDIPEFKAEKGAKFSFLAGDEHKKFLHLCEVTEVIPGKKLTYSWRYDGYQGNSFVTFDLLEHGDHTFLKLTHSGLETFPADTKDFARENFVKGWDHIINVSLKKYLEG